MKIGQTPSSEKAKVLSTAICKEIFIWFLDFTEHLLYCNVSLHKHSTQRYKVTLFWYCDKDLWVGGMSVTGTVNADHYLGEASCHDLVST